MSGRLWGGVEYLLWWIRDGPLPFPLVTTGNPNDPIPGALGQSGTQTLFGGNGLDFGTFSGCRVTLGGWQDCCQTFGLEVSGFLLETRVAGFAAAGDAAGNPPIYMPVFRADLGEEGSFTIADPVLGLTSSLAIQATSQLWGAEGNRVAGLFRSDRLAVDVLARFRYLDLDEQLNIHALLNDPVFDVQQDLTDDFATRSQFYGGQLGTRLRWQQGNWQVAADVKVALGLTHQVVRINGASTIGGSGAFVVGTFPGGILAQPSNIGRDTEDQFTVVPEVRLQVSRQLGRRLRASVGYNFLYWSDVVRPGLQIDRAINPTQQFGGPLVGPARPTALLKGSDFGVHGVNFGLAWSY